MFTGIIECTGKLVSLSKKGTNISFWISSPISGALKTDQSVSHEGVCLTVEACENGMHCVTAIEETLSKTNVLSSPSWRRGNKNTKAEWLKKPPVTNRMSLLASMRLRDKMISPRCR